MLDRLRYCIQDGNLNFLLGSGMSRPYLATLGNIESLFTAADRLTASDAKAQIIRCSLYRKYFNEVIYKNVGVLESNSEAENVSSQYRAFLGYINQILLRRRSTLLSKEANLFTTNIDLFLDKALEDLNLEYNDGFNGRFLPAFSLSNFKKSRFKKSLHYDNTAEIPVFNLLKLHGSLCWQLADSGKIHFASELGVVKKLHEQMPDNSHLLDIEEKSSIQSLLEKCAGKASNKSITDFMRTYEDLLIVNPTKEKFRHTLLNQTYYEMLRIYSNELEKENTVLFALGFSFADEHILEITLRAANSNPTLLICIFAHSANASEDLKTRFKIDNVTNRNVMVLPPPLNEDGSDEYPYDFQHINEKVFGKLFPGDTSYKNLAEIP